MTGAQDVQVVMGNMRTEIAWWTAAATGKPVLPRSRMASIARVVNDIGVVPAEAQHGVGAAVAVQVIGAIIARQRVVVAVTGQGNRGEARAVLGRHVFDENSGAQRIADRRKDRVVALARPCGEETG